MRTTDETMARIDRIQAELAKYTRDELVAMLVTLGASGSDTETERRVDQVLETWAKDRK